LETQRARLPRFGHRRLADDHTRAQDRAGPRPARAACLARRAQPRRARRRYLAASRPPLRAHRQRARIPPPPGGGLMPPRRAPGSAWGLDTEPADDWRDLAACRDEDPELFFPIGTSGPALLQVEQAKAVCRRCPVAAECLTWALGHPEEYGIWGGLTEGERRALRHTRPPRDARAAIARPSRAAPRPPTADTYAAASRSTTPAAPATAAPPPSRDGETASVNGSGSHPEELLAWVAA